MNPIQPLAGLAQPEIQENTLTALPQDILIKRVFPHLDSNNRKALRACCRELKDAVNNAVHSVNITPSNYPPLFNDPLKFPTAQSLKFSEIPGLQVKAYTDNLPPPGTGKIQKLQLDYLSLPPTLILPNLRHLILNECSAASDFSLDNTTRLNVLDIRGGSGLNEYLNCASLQSLREIHITRMRGYDKSPWLTGQASLTKLSAQYSNIKDIHLPSAGGLRELRLAGVRPLNSLYNLFQQNELTSICIIDACLTALDLGQAANLRQLNLDELPHLNSVLNLAALSSLRAIEIQEVNISALTLPEKGNVTRLELWRLRNLNSLKLRHQNKLQKLALSNINIRTLADLSSLTQLTELIIYTAQGDLQNMNLAPLVNLESLELSHVPISSLLLPKISPLTFLYLDSLRHLPADLDLTHQTNLEKLCLDSCEIRTIIFPERSRLEEVRLSYLPRLIGSLNLSLLSKLQTLNLWECSITGITFPENGDLECVRLNQLSSVSGNLDLRWQIYLE